jgi:membrane-associated phospholipid phosphatase
MSRSISSDSFTGSARLFSSRRLFEPRAVPAYCLCSLAVLIIAAAVSIGAFDFDRKFFFDAAYCTGIVFAFAFAARWLGFSIIADPVEQIALLYSTGLFLAFCSAIAASTAAPMADAALRSADMFLFRVDRVRFIAEMNLGRDAIRFWAFVYNSLSVTPALALALLVVTGKNERAWVMLTAMLLAAFISVIFIAILPAYGTPPFPYEFVAVFDGLREGRLRILDGSVVTGMSTFPSMHAAHATILAVAFSWMGRFAIPLVVLNILMIGSALMVGGHYMVDLVAGIVVGAGAIQASLRLHRHMFAAASKREHVTR